MRSQLQPKIRISWAGVKRKVGETIKTFKKFSVLLSWFFEQANGKSVFQGSFNKNFKKSLLKFHTFD